MIIELRFRSYDVYTERKIASGVKSQNPSPGGTCKMRNETKRNKIYRNETKQHHVYLRHITLRGFQNGPIEEQMSVPIKK
jgi:hypothetical protein